MAQATLGQMSKVLKVDPLPRAVGVPRVPSTPLHFLNVRLVAGNLAMGGWLGGARQPQHHLAKGPHVHSARHSILAASQQFPACLWRFDAAGNPAPHSAVSKAGWLPVLVTRLIFIEYQMSNQGCQSKEDVL